MPRDNRLSVLAKMNLHKELAKLICGFTELTSIQELTAAFQLFQKNLKLQIAELNGLKTNPSLEQDKLNLIDDEIKSREAMLSDINDKFIPEIDQMLGGDLTDRDLKPIEIERVRNQFKRHYPNQKLGDKIIITRKQLFKALGISMPEMDEGSAAQRVYVTQDYASETAMDKNSTLLKVKDEILKARKYKEKLVQYCQHPASGKKDVNNPLWKLINKAQLFSGPRRALVAFRAQRDFINHAIRIAHEGGDQRVSFPSYLDFNGQTIVVKPHYLKVQSGQTRVAPEFVTMDITTAKARLETLLYKIIDVEEKLEFIKNSYSQAKNEFMDKAINIFPEAFLKDPHYKNLIESKEFYASVVNIIEQTINDDMSTDMLEFKRSTPKLLYVNGRSQHNYDDYRLLRALTTPKTSTQDDPTTLTGHVEALHYYVMDDDGKPSEIVVNRHTGDLETDNLTKYQIDEITSVTLTKDIRKVPGTDFHEVKKVVLRHAQRPYYTYEEKAVYHLNKDKYGEPGKDTVNPETGKVTPNNEAYILDEGDKVIDTQIEFFKEKDCYKVTKTIKRLVKTDHAIVSAAHLRAKCIIPAPLENDVRMAIYNERLDHFIEWFNRVESAEPHGDRFEFLSTGENPKYYSLTKEEALKGFMNAYAEFRQVQHFLPADKNNEMFRQKLIGRQVDHYFDFKAESELGKFIFEKSILKPVFYFSEVENIQVNILQKRIILDSEVSRLINDFNHIPEAVQFLSQIRSVEDLVAIYDKDLYIAEINRRLEFNPKAKEFFDNILDATHSETPHAKIQKMSSEGLAELKEIPGVKEILADLEFAEKVTKTYEESKNIASLLDDRILSIYKTYEEIIKGRDELTKLIEKRPSRARKKGSPNVSNKKGKTLITDFAISKAQQLKLKEFSKEITGFSGEGQKSVISERSNISGTLDDFQNNMNKESPLYKSQSKQEKAFFEDQLNKKEGGSPKGHSHGKNVPGVSKTKYPSGKNSGQNKRKIKKALHHISPDMVEAFRALNKAGYASYQYFLKETKTARPKATKKDAKYIQVAHSSDEQNNNSSSQTEPKKPRLSAQQKFAQNMMNLVDSIIAKRNSLNDKDQFKFAVEELLSLMLPEVIDAEGAEVINEKRAHLAQLNEQIFDKLQGIVDNAPNFIGHFEKDVFLNKDNFIVWEGLYPAPLREKIKRDILEHLEAFHEHDELVKKLEAEINELDILSLDRESKEQQLRELQAKREVSAQNYRDNAKIVHLQMAEHFLEACFQENGEAFIKGRYGDLLTEKFRKFSEAYQGLNETIHEYEKTRVERKDLLFDFVKAQEQNYIYEFDDVALNELFPEEVTNSRVTSTQQSLSAAGSEQILVKKQDLLIDIAEIQFQFEQEYFKFLRNVQKRETTSLKDKNQIVDLAQDLRNVYLQYAELETTDHFKEIGSDSLSEIRKYIEKTRFDKIIDTIMDIHEFGEDTTVDDGYEKKLHAAKDSLTLNQIFFKNVHSIVENFLSIDALPENQADSSRSTALLGAKQELHNKCDLRGITHFHFLNETAITSYVNKIRNLRDDNTKQSLIAQHNLIQSICDELESAESHLNKDLLAESKSYIDALNKYTLDALQETVKEDVPQYLPDDVVKNKQQQLFDQYIELTEPNETPPNDIDEKLAEIKNQFEAETKQSFEDFKTDYEHYKSRFADLRQMVDRHNSMVGELADNKKKPHEKQQISEDKKQVKKEAKDLTDELARLLKQSKEKYGVVFLNHPIPKIERKKNYLGHIYIIPQNYAHNLPHETASAGTYIPDVDTSDTKDTISQEKTKILNDIADTQFQFEKEYFAFLRNVQNGQLTLYPAKNSIMSLAKRLRNLYIKFEGLEKSHDFSSVTAESLSSIRNFIEGQRLNVAVDQFASSQNMSDAESIAALKDKINAADATQQKQVFDNVQSIVEKFLALDMLALNNQKTKRPQAALALSRSQHNIYDLRGYTHYNLMSDENTKRRYRNAVFNILNRELSNHYNVTDENVKEICETYEKGMEILETQLGEADKADTYYDLLHKQLHVHIETANTAAKPTIVKAPIDPQKAQLLNEIVEMQLQLEEDYVSLLEQTTDNGYDIDFDKEARNSINQLELRELYFKYADLEIKARFEDIDPNKLAEIKSAVMQARFEKALKGNEQHIDLFQQNSNAYLDHFALQEKLTDTFLKIYDQQYFIDFTEDKIGKKDRDVKQGIIQQRAKVKAKGSNLINVFQLHLMPSEEGQVYIDKIKFEAGETEAHVNELKRKYGNKLYKQFMAYGKEVLRRFNLAKEALDIYQGDYVSSQNALPEINDSYIQLLQETSKKPIVVVDTNAADKKAQLLNEIVETQLQFEKDFFAQVEKANKGQDFEVSDELAEKIDPENLKKLYIQYLDEETSQFADIKNHDGLTEIRVALQKARFEETIGQAVEHLNIDNNNAHIQSFSHRQSILETLFEVNDLFVAGTDLAEHGKQKNYIQQKLLKQKKRKTKASDSALVLFIDDIYDQRIALYQFQVNLSGAKFKQAIKSQGKGAAEKVKERSKILLKSYEKGGDLRDIYRNEYLPLQQNLPEVDADYIKRMTTAPANVVDNKAQLLNEIVAEQLRLENAFFDFLKQAAIGEDFVITDAQIDASNTEKLRALYCDYLGIEDFSEFSEGDNLNQLRAKLAEARFENAVEDSVKGTKYSESLFVKHSHHYAQKQSIIEKYIKLDYYQDISDIAYVSVAKVAGENTVRPAKEARLSTINLSIFFAPEKAEDDYNKLKAGLKRAKDSKDNIVNRHGIDQYKNTLAYYDAQMILSESAKDIHTIYTGDYVTNETNLPKITPDYIDECKKAAKKAQILNQIVEMQLPLEKELLIFVEGLNNGTTTTTSQETIDKLNSEKIQKLYLEYLDETAVQFTEVTNDEGLAKIRDALQKARFEEIIGKKIDHLNLDQGNNHIQYFSSIQSMIENTFEMNDHINIQNEQDKICAEHKKSYKEGVPSQKSNAVINISATSYMSFLSNDVYQPIMDRAAPFINPSEELLTNLKNQEGPVYTAALVKLMQASYNSSKAIEKLRDTYRGDYIRLQNALPEITDDYIKSMTKPKKNINKAFERADLLDQIIEEQLRLEKDLAAFLDRLTKGRNFALNDKLQKKLNTNPLRSLYCQYLELDHDVLDFPEGKALDAIRGAVGKARFEEALDNGIENVVLNSEKYPQHFEFYANRQALTETFMQVHRYENAKKEAYQKVSSDKKQTSQKSLRISETNYSIFLSMDDYEKNLKESKEIVEQIEAKKDDFLLVGAEDKYSHMHDAAQYALKEVELAGQIHSIYTEDIVPAEQDLPKLTVDYVAIREQRRRKIEIIKDIIDEQLKYEKELFAFLEEASKGRDIDVPNHIQHGTDIEKIKKLYLEYADLDVNGNISDIPAAVLKDIKMNVQGARHSREALAVSESAKQIGSNKLLSSIPLSQELSDIFNARQEVFDKMLRADAFVKAAKKSVMQSSKVGQPAQEATKKPTKLSKSVFFTRFIENEDYYNRKIAEYVRLSNLSLDEFKNHYNLTDDNDAQSFMDSFKDNASAMEVGNELYAYYQNDYLPKAAKLPNAHMAIIISADRAYKKQLTQTQQDSYVQDNDKQVKNWTENKPQITQEIKTISADTAFKNQLTKMKELYLHLLSDDYNLLTGASDHPDLAAFNAILKQMANYSSVHYIKPDASFDSLYTAFYLDGIMTEKVEAFIKDNAHKIKSQKKRNAFTTELRELSIKREKSLYHFRNVSVQAQYSGSLGFHFYKELMDKGAIEDYDFETKNKQLGVQAKKLTDLYKQMKEAYVSDPSSPDIKNLQRQIDNQIDAINQFKANDISMVVNDQQGINFSNEKFGKKLTDMIISKRQSIVESLNVAAQNLAHSEYRLHQLCNKHQLNGQKLLHASHKDIQKSVKQGAKNYKNLRMVYALEAMLSGADNIDVLMVPLESEFKSYLDTLAEKYEFDLKTVTVQKLIEASKTELQKIQDGPSLAYGIMDEGFGNASINTIIDPPVEFDSFISTEALDDKTLQSLQEVYEKDLQKLKKKITQARRQSTSARILFDKQHQNWSKTIDRYNNTRTEAPRVNVSDTNAIQVNEKYTNIFGIQQKNSIFYDADIFFQTYVAHSPSQDYSLQNLRERIFKFSENTGYKNQYNIICNAYDKLKKHQKELNHLELEQKYQFAKTRIDHSINLRQEGSSYLGVIEADLEKNKNNLNALKETFENRKKAYFDLIDQNVEEFKKTYGINSIDTAKYGMHCFLSDIELPMHHSLIDIQKVRDEVYALNHEIKYQEKAIASLESSLEESKLFIQENPTLIERIDRKKARLAEQTGSETPTDPEAKRKAVDKDLLTSVEAYSNIPESDVSMDIYQRLRGDDVTKNAAKSIMRTGQLIAQINYLSHGEYPFHYVSEYIKNKREPIVKLLIEDSLSNTKMYIDSMYRPTLGNNNEVTILYAIKKEIENQYENKINAHIESLAQDNLLPNNQINAYKEKLLSLVEKRAALDMQHHSLVAMNFHNIIQNAFYQASQNNTPIHGSAVANLYSKYASLNEEYWKALANNNFNQAKANSKEIHADIFAEIVKIEKEFNQASAENPSLELKLDKENKRKFTNKYGHSIFETYKSAHKNRKHTKYFTEQVYKQSLDLIEYEKSLGLEKGFLHSLDPKLETETIEFKNRIYEAYQVYSCYQFLYDQNQAGYQQIYRQPGTMMAGVIFNNPDDALRTVNKRKYEWNSLRYFIDENSQVWKELKLQLDKRSGLKYSFATLHDWEKDRLLEYRSMEERQLNKIEEDIIELQQEESKAETELRKKSSEISQMFEEENIKILLSCDEPISNYIEHDKLKSLFERVEQNSYRASFYDISVSNDLLTVKDYLLYAFFIGNKKEANILAEIALDSLNIEDQTRRTQILDSLSKVIDLYMPLRSNFGAQRSQLGEENYQKIKTESLINAIDNQLAIIEADADALSNMNFDDQVADTKQKIDALSVKKSTNNDHKQYLRDSTNKLEKMFGPFKDEAHRKQFIGLLLSSDMFIMTPISSFNALNNDVPNGYDRDNVDAYKERHNLIVMNTEDIAKYPQYRAELAKKNLDPVMGQILGQEPNAAELSEEQKKQETKEREEAKEKARREARAKRQKAFDTYIDETEKYDRIIQLENASDLTEADIEEYDKLTQEAENMRAARRAMATSDLRDSLENAEVKELMTYYENYKKLNKRFIKNIEAYNKKVAVYEDPKTDNKTKKELRKTLSEQQTKLGQQLTELNIIQKNISSKFGGIKMTRHPMPELTYAVDGRDKFRAYNIPTIQKSTPNGNFGLISGVGFWIPNSNVTVYSIAKRAFKPVNQKLKVVSSEIRSFVYEQTGKVFDKSIMGVKKGWKMTKTAGGFAFKSAPLAGGVGLTLTEGLVMLNNAYKSYKQGEYVESAGWIGGFIAMEAAFEPATWEYLAKISARIPGASRAFLFMGESVQLLTPFMIPFIVIYGGENGAAARDVLVDVGFETDKAISDLFSHRDSAKLQKLKSSLEQIIEDKNASEVKRAAAKYIKTYVEIVINPYEAMKDSYAGRFYRNYLSEGAAALLNLPAPFFKKSAILSNEFLMSMGYMNEYPNEHDTQNFIDYKFNETFKRKRALSEKFNEIMTKQIDSRYYDIGVRKAVKTLMEVREFYVFNKPLAEIKEFDELVYGVDGKLDMVPTTRRPFYEGILEDYANVVVSFDRATKTFSIKIPLRDRYYPKDKIDVEKGAFVDSEKRTEIAKRNLSEIDLLIYMRQNPQFNFLFDRGQSHNPDFMISNSQSSYSTRYKKAEDVINELTKGFDNLRTFHTAQGLKGLADRVSVKKRMHPLYERMSVIKMTKNTPFEINQNYTLVKPDINKGMVPIMIRHAKAYIKDCDPNTLRVITMRTEPYTMMITEKGSEFRKGYTYPKTVEKHSYTVYKNGKVVDNMKNIDPIALARYCADNKQMNFILKTNKKHELALSQKIASFSVKPHMGLTVPEPMTVEQFRSDRKDHLDHVYYMFPIDNKEHKTTSVMVVDSYFQEVARAKSIEALSQELSKVSSFSSYTGLENLNSQTKEVLKQNKLKTFFEYLAEGDNLKKSRFVSMLSSASLLTRKSVVIDYTPFIGYEKVTYRSHVHKIKTDSSSKSKMEYGLTMLKKGGYKLTYHFGDTALVRSMIFSNMTQLADYLKYTVKGSIQIEVNTGGYMKKEIFKAFAKLNEDVASVPREEFFVSREPVLRWEQSGDITYDLYPPELEFKNMPPLDTSKYSPPIIMGTEATPFDLSHPEIYADKDKKGSLGKK